MMTTLRGTSQPLTKVTDPMKTLNPTPDRTTSLFSESAMARPSGAGKLRLAGVLLTVAAVFSGVSSARAQTTPPTPQTVLVADFNHDGIPDVLVESTTTPTATISFGSVPYGTFGGSKAVTFPASCVTPLSGSLAVGDFNGDGFADIAFSCASSSGTMLGNGDGTFGAATTLAGAGTGPAIVGDFDKDGKLDIVILETIRLSAVSQTIQFLSGNGDGTFNEAQLSNLAANTYTSLVATDLNADGYPDLVLFNAPTDSPKAIEVYGNNKNGTFGSGSQGIFSPSTTANVSTLGAATVLVGNVFGPATSDVIVAAPGQNGNLFAYQNKSSATGFSFNDPVTIPVANLTGVQAGQFSGSGFTDVAVSNGTNISVLTNDGKGNFAATYSSLTLTSASSLFAVADANADGYADIYTANLSQTGATKLDVALTTGSATATSQPFSLAIGTRAIAASWAGNVNFAGSSPTGSQVVIGLPSLTTLASSKNPSLVADAVTFSVHVAPGPNAGSTLTPTGTMVLTDGTSILASGVLDGTGNFSFTTSVLTQATHTITATYAGDGLYAGSFATVMQVVNPKVTAVTISSFTPTTVTLGSGATTITVTGAGFGTNSTVQVNGTAIQTTVVSPTTLTAIIPASYFSNIGTLQITVFDPTLSSTSSPVALTVTAPAPAAVVDVPPTAQPGTQPTLTLSLTQPYPLDITATATLSFAASTTPAVNDPNILFADTGTTSEDVTIPAGSVTVPPIKLQAGTVAGTITVPIKLTAAGADITPSTLQPGVIVVPASVPTISAVTTTRSGKQLTVVVHGFSNTREMLNAKFHFTPAVGATLGTTDLTIASDTIFNTNWFQTTPSNQYGSTFTYTQIFNTSDDATTIGSVDVTLSNTIGASDKKTAQ